MVELLAEYKKSIFSEWIFPSRTKPGQPIDPGYIRKRFQVILERARCKAEIAALRSGAARNIQTE